MKKGIVVSFNAQRGFGFIKEENGENIFVHFSGIVSDRFKTLDEGDIVTYEVNQGVKGLHAVNVVVVK